MLIIASLHTYEQGSRKKQANRGRSARERATGGKLFSCNGIFTVDDKAMTKLYNLKPANSKTICHPPRLNRRARRKRAIALKSRNNVQATDWSGRAGPTKQRKSYHHFTMPPKTVTLTPSPTFGNQRNRRSASWISRLTQLQSLLPPSATTKNEKKENHRADTDAVSTRTRSKTEKRRIATEPVSARTRSRSKHGILNEQNNRETTKPRGRPIEITFEVEVTAPLVTTKKEEAIQPQCQELTVDEWEIHFRNERRAAERDQDLINNGDNHGNTSCGRSTTYWTAGSPTFWTAQTKPYEKENSNVGSFDLDTSTISSSTKSDSLEEEGYKGITQIEKGLFEVYIDRNDTLKIAGVNPGEYLDGTLDSDWIDAEFNIETADDNSSYAKDIAYEAQEYVHTQIAREREDRLSQEVLNKLKRRGIIIKLEKEAVVEETKGKRHRCKAHGAARSGEEESKSTMERGKVIDHFAGETS